MLLSDLVSKFLEWCTLHRKPRTVEFYRGQLDGLLRALGDQPAADLDRRHLLTLKLSWHRLWSLQRLYSWAVIEAGYLVKNPFAGLKRPKLGQRTFVVGKRELLPLLRKCRPCFRRLMLCQRETAARPQEGRLLRWDQLRAVNPDADFWREVLNGWSYFDLEEFKSMERLTDQGDRRFIPVSPRLGRLLHRLWQSGQRQGVIFKNERGEPWTKESIRSQVRRLRDKAAVLSGRTFEKFCMYTVRHSTATDMVRKNVNLKVIAQVLGHKELRMTNRYLHLHKEDVMRELNQRWIRKRDKQ